ncbi:Cu-binding protein [Balamuthia mandrillaris]
MMTQRSLFSLAPSSGRPLFQGGAFASAQRPPSLCFRASFPQSARQRQPSAQLPLLFPSSSSRRMMFTGRTSSSPLFRPRNPMFPLRRADSPQSNSGSGGYISHKKSQPYEAMWSWRSVAVFVTVGGALLALYETEKKKKRAQPQLESIGKPLLGGPFTLVDHNGTPVTDATYRGKYMLIYFGFTFCPDICPAELSKMSKAVDLMEQNEGVEPGLVVPMFISVDPYRDTVKQIRLYVKDFHPRMVGLTGTPQQVEKAARAFRVYSASSQHNEEDEDYLVDHSIFFYLMDKEGEFLQYYGSDVDAPKMAKLIAEELKKAGEAQQPQTLLQRVKQMFWS